MRRAGDKQGKKIKSAKHELIYGAAVGMTMFGLSAAIVLIVYPDVFLPNKIDSSETSALMDVPDNTSQVQIWQDEEKSELTQYVQTKVAIVNMDEGILINGEKIRYSDQILELPKDGEYQFVSYSEARDGLKDGSFGAMIRIPASFSQHVESINKIPDPCILKYEMSDLVGESQRFTLYKMINDFEMTLSNDMSFMYISNLMSRYHEAQDDATVIMSNDQADYEALSDLDYTDLISLVEVKSFTREELITELPELESFTTNQYLLSSELEQSFDDTISSVLDGMNQVFDQAGSLDVKTQYALDATPQPMTHQEIDDTEVITSVNAYIMSQLTEKIADQKLFEENAQAEIDELIFKYGEILNESIERQNIESETLWHDTLEFISDQYKMNMPKLEFDANDESVDLYYIDDEGRSSSLCISIQSVEEEMMIDENLDQKRQLQSELQYFMAENAGNSDSKIVDIFSDFEVTYGQELNLCGYDSAAELLTDDLYEANSSCAKTLLIEGDLEQMQAYVMEKTYDESLLTDAKERFRPLTDTAYSTLKVDENTVSLESTDDGSINDESTEADTLLTELDKIEKVLQHQSETRISIMDDLISNMKTTLYDSVSGMIHEQLTENAEKIITEVMTEVNNSIESSKILIEEVAHDTQAFRDNAASTASEIRVSNYPGSAYIMEMNANYRELLLACSAYNDEINHYASELDALTIQYGHDIENQVAKMKSDADQLLLTGLDGIRRQRKENYDENQKILSDFINSLYYTRLGSRENSSLYRYVADPVRIENSQ